MARVRIEWVRLGRGSDYAGGGWVNTIEETFGVPVSLEVTDTATAGANRPVVPAFGSYSRGHARIIADADVILAFGADPTADPATLGNYIQSGVDTVVMVSEGQLLSFIAATSL